MNSHDRAAMGVADARLGAATPGASASSPACTSACTPAYRAPSAPPGASAPAAGLKALPSGSRPREKLLAQGPSALSDAELLALLLRTGTRGQGVLQLADQLINAHGGLAGLLQAPAGQLPGIKGLGPAKRAELSAVLEIARRTLAQTLRERPVFDSPQSLAQYLQLHIAHKPHEVFSVIFLDSQHRLIALEELFRGTLSQTSVYPREVVLRALHHHAAAVVLAHNHPSGLAQPSRADQALTQALKAALALVDVRVLDHLVVTPGQSQSMAQLGMV